MNSIIIRTILAILTGTALATSAQANKCEIEPAFEHMARMTGVSEIQALAISIQGKTFFEGGTEPICLEELMELRAARAVDLSFSTTIDESHKANAKNFNRIRSYLLSKGFYSSTTLDKLSQREKEKLNAHSIDLGHFMDKINNYRRKEFADVTIPILTKPKESPKDMKRKLVNYAKYQVVGMMAGLSERTINSSYQEAMRRPRAIQESHELAQKAYEETKAGDDMGLDASGLPYSALEEEESQQLALILYNANPDHSPYAVSTEEACILCKHSAIESNSTQ